MIFHHSHSQSSITDDHIPPRVPLHEKQAEGHAAGSTAISPPPDGGSKAWMHTVFLHIVCFNTWGVNNSFGVFQQYYAAELLSSQSQSTISWIGSVQVFCLFVIGTFSGRATDMGYFRITFIIGVFFQLLGILMASLGSSYYQIFLSQGICVGIGNGLVLVPSMAVTSTYFSTKRAIAISIGSSGAATGGLVFPVLTERLIAAQGAGYGWAMRCIGFVMLLTYIPCLIWYSPRLAPRKSGPLIDPSALREIQFWFFTVAMYFTFWGLYTVFFYIGTFARDSIGMTGTVNLILVLNGAGLIGRLAPGIVAAKCTGVLNLLIPLTALASLLAFLWSQVQSQIGLYIFAVFYGFVAHSVQALSFAFLGSLTTDPQKLATRAGMVTSLTSVALLTGPSISGTLIQHTNGSYFPAQVFTGISMLLSALFFTALRVARVGTNIRIKV
ncbi:uncharacterized protein FPRO_15934 [Fusarium proliferatum ET1]|uniref:Related to monocarboxylate transporter 4 n=1 Tax=Fusarium proliferatum (strain ET1) TaxID=1227346 RepID=A0A1L7WAE3_FUSPR|nr:uncharacterized protein FPRO_15934 [Fusarium proliferatum ET1]CZR49575.1 related to monocarboxylate transporter 4 [Fusarium proliferatum ET1]